MPEKQQSPLWKQVAENWRSFGPPLRPCSEDIGAMENAVAEWEARSSGDACSALLWGVTPEIANMKWPDGTALVAIDRSEVMIKVVWPGDMDGVRKAYCGEWLDSCLVVKNPVAVVIGDGCFNTLDYPEGYRALFGTAHRALENKGVLIMRFFLQPDEHEEPDTVFGELHANRIGNFHVFKFRLAMAVQEDIRKGVKVNDVWKIWKDADIDKGSLVSMTGWQEEVINTIALYEGKNARLSFPTSGELAAVFSEGFKEVARAVPEYEMGERCPVLVLEKRA